MRYDCTRNARTTNDSNQDMVDAKGDLKLTPEVLNKFFFLNLYSEMLLLCLNGI
jgi:hypothetical protein